MKMFNRNKSLYESLIKNIAKEVKYAINESFKSNKLIKAFGNNPKPFIDMYAKYGISFENVSDENIEYIPFNNTSDNVDDNILNTLNNVISTLRKFYTNEELNKIKNATDNYSKAFILNFKTVVKVITNSYSILEKCGGLGFITNFGEHKNIYNFYKAYIYKQIDTYNLFYKSLAKDNVNINRLIDNFESCTGMCNNHARLGNIFNSHLFRPVFPALNGIIVLNLNGVKELLGNSKKMINRDNNKKPSDLENNIKYKRYWHNQYKKYVEELKNAEWVDKDGIKVNKISGKSKDDYIKELNKIKNYLKENINFINESYDNDLFTDDIFNLDDSIDDELNMADTLELYDYVDLGLPSGTLWCKYNVGANRQEEYGDYLSWDTANDKYDNLPTKKLFNELIQNCKIEKYTCNNINGIKFIGKNNKFIFLPFAGFKLTGTKKTHGSGFSANYWSSTIYKDYETNAWRLNYSNNCNLFYAPHDYLYSIRLIKNRHKLKN